MSCLKRLSFESLEEKTPLAADLAIVEPILPDPVQPDVPDWLCDITGSTPGDANCDGAFNSTDLVKVMQEAEYEDDVRGNSTWTEGDFDGDGDFTTKDLVLALKIGDYEGDENNGGVSTEPWDLNGDFEFNTKDLVIVFLEGRFEADDDEPTVSDQGDWNQDGVFDSSDLVAAMKAGQYEMGRFF